MKTMSWQGRTAVSIVLVIVAFVFFFNGYQNEGPSRRKFRKSGESSVDLTREERTVVVVEDDLAKVKSDARVQRWVESWKRCVPDLKLESLVDVGAADMEDEAVDAALVTEDFKGPAKMFYSKSPSGKRMINPYWGRLLFRKEGDDWQPYIELRCGILAFEPKGMRARVVQSCTMNEGMDDVFWLDADRAVVVGYESVTRQMSSECESVESCFAPSLLYFDFQKNLVHAYRGKVLKRGLCQLDQYLRTRLPEFYGK